MQDLRKQDILKILNLEDTPPKHPAPSRLRDREASFLLKRLPVCPSPYATTQHERSRRRPSRFNLFRSVPDLPGLSLFVASHCSKAQKPVDLERPAREDVLARRSSTNPNGMQESIMSAINGDKARFHRERKQKIARRKRTRELLNQAPTPRKAVESSGRARPGSVSE